MSKLIAGDRVAYAAKFLRATGQLTGAAPQRRGTFLRHDFNGFCRVRWDNEGEYISSGRGQYADDEYCRDVRENGNLVAITNIAKVGSPRFALNDL
jgi:hypothetical protein